MADGYFLFWAFHLYKNEEQGVGRPLATFAVGVKSFSTLHV